jgi:O-antigen/teichoic acid export membrane protein
MRRNTAWAFAGNSVYAGSQWAVFVLLAHTLPVEEVGVYAYATAVTGPIFVLANLQLRNVLATRLESSEGFADYLIARLLTTALAVVVSLVIGALVAPRVGSFAVVALLTAGRACDAISEICHGLFQRELDMRRAATGLVIHGLLSVVFVGLVLAASHSLAWATTAYVAGSVLALAGWDLPHAIAMRTRASVASRRRPAIDDSLASAWRLIVTALPLGLSSAIANVEANVPRYVIASYLGPAALARFAAISYVTMAGHLVVNATCQAALPMLARDVHESRRQHRRRLGQLVAATIVLGGALVAVTFVIGRPALPFVYGGEYANDAGVLLWLVAGTVVTFASVFLGAGTTARQRFSAQFVISATSLVVVLASTGPLVSRFGLTGAAWALLASAGVELGAYVALTLRDLSGGERIAPTVVAGALAGGARR